MARPTIYTDELADQICQGLRDGLPREVAAGQHVAVSTFYLWLKDRPEFSEVVEKAEADFAAMAHRGILHADGGKDAQPWTRLAWLLERRRPEFYKLETTVKHSGEINTELGVLTRLAIAGRKAAKEATPETVNTPTDAPAPSGQMVPGDVLPNGDIMAEGDTNPDGSPIMEGDT